MTMERRVLAVVAVGLLDVVVVAMSVVAMHMAGGVQVPALVTIVAVIMAHVSLCGLWWARSDWPSHLRTLIAIAGCGALWGLLLLVLAESRRDATRGAGWAASLGTQVMVAALLASLVELARSTEAPRRGGRFSIAFLLLWTTAVAVLLGGGRWLAGRLGWTAESFFAWEYFGQLQALAVANGVLAASLLACVRLAVTWPGRGAALAVTVVVVTACTMAAMYGLFSGKVGASLPEMAWLTVVQGMFLVVALVVGEVAESAKPMQQL